MLTTLKIKSARPAERAYKLADTGGLFLLVQPNGSKLWRYKFRLSGIEGLHALGSYPEVSLADARREHIEARKLVAKGVHPVRIRPTIPRCLPNFWANSCASWTPSRRSTNRPALRCCSLC